MYLSNRYAVITGCNRGIGKSILEVFASHGANIYACVRKETPELLSYLNNVATKHSIEIFPIAFDFENTDQVKAGIKDILSFKNRIDILINNAGIASGALFQMTPASELEKVLRINFLSQMLFTQGLVRSMQKNNCGAIINISSVAGIIGDAGTLSYGASKAALILATKVLAKELGRFNIRVNAIAPSLTKTDMFDEMDVSARQKMIDSSALKRVCDPEEVANVALFLSSNLSSFITGQTICVDGGMTH